MKRIYIFCFLITLSLLFTSLSIQAQDDISEMYQYTSERFGFSLELPSDWFIEELENAPVMVLNNENARSIAGNLRGLYAFMQFDYITQFAESAENASEIMQHYLQIAGTTPKDSIKRRIPPSGIDIAYGWVNDGITFSDSFVIFAVTEDNLVLFIEARFRNSSLNNFEEMLLDMVATLIVDNSDLYDVELSRKYTVDSFFSFSFRYPESWYIETVSRGVVNVLTVPSEEFDGETGEIALVLSQTDSFSAGAFSGSPGAYLSAFVANSPQLPFSDSIIWQAIFKSRVGAYIENRNYDATFRSIYTVVHEPGYAIFVQIIASDETYFALEPTIMRIITSLEFEG